MIPEEYLQQIKLWRIKYNVVQTPSSFDPTQWKVACRKCEKHRQTSHRHHMGNDLFFARMLPDVFAPRYIEFHPDDVAKLCDRCHKRIHAIYKPITKAVWVELNKHGQKVITEEWCRKWMTVYRAAFDAWVKVKPKKRRRRRKRRLTAKREVRKRA